MNQQALMNRGIYDSRIRKERPRAALKSLFEKQLEKHHHDMSAAQLKSHPITLYDRHTTLSKNRVLFVGDAAGTDPLFGEGIPFALAYGEVAAEEIVEAFNTQQFHFRDYKTRISHHRLLNQLPSRALAARFLYKLPHFPWILRPLSAASAYNLSPARSDETALYPDDRSPAWTKLHNKKPDAFSSPIAYNESIKDNLETRRKWVWSHMELMKHVGQRSHSGITMQMDNLFMPSRQPVSIAVPDARQSNPNVKMFSFLTLQYKRKPPDSVHVNAAVHRISAKKTHTNTSSSPHAGALSNHQFPLR